MDAAILIIIAAVVYFLILLTILPMLPMIRCRLLFSIFLSFHFLLRY